MKNYEYSVTFERYEGEKYQGTKFQTVVDTHCSRAAQQVEAVTGNFVVDVTRIKEIKHT